MGCWRIDDEIFYIVNYRVYEFDAYNAWTGQSQFVKSEREPETKLGVEPWESKSR